MMNMLVGVLCDVVSSVAAETQDAHFNKDVDEKVGKLVRSMDSDGDGVISEQEFCTLMDDQDAIECLDELGVDIVNLLDFCFAKFYTKKEIPTSDFFFYINQFRASKVATVKDVADLRIFTTRRCRNRSVARRGRSSAHAPRRRSWRLTR